MKSKFFNYSKAENLQKFSQSLTPQDYYNTYLGMYWFAIVLTKIAQALSGASEFAYFQTVFSASLNGLLLIGATVLFCLLIEVSKFFIVGAFFKEMFLLKRSHANPFLLLLALLISGVSIYASVIGGGSFGIDTAKVSSTESKHDGEISTLRNDIKAIEKRNSWKGNTYISGKEKALLHAKEQELSKAKQAKESELQQVQMENASNENAYRYWFASFEVIFLLATIFGYYFEKRSSVECTDIGTIQTIDNDSEQVQKVGFSSIPNSTIAPNNTGQKIGFSFGNSENRIANIVSENRVPSEGNRICKHCNKSYTYKHHKQVYCSNECRNESWEQRTGKKLNFKKGGN
jgi:hypothetical protein